MSNIEVDDFIKLDELVVTSPGGSVGAVAAFEQAYDAEPLALLETLSIAI